MTKRRYYTLDEYGREREIEASSDFYFERIAEEERLDYERSAGNNCRKIDCAACEGYGVHTTVNGDEACGACLGSGIHYVHKEDE